MRTSLLLLLLIAPFASAQTGTFTFSTSPEKDPSGLGVSAVTETVNGITLTITATGGGASTLGAWDYGDWKGMDGYTVANSNVITSLVVTFDAAVNVASLRFADGDGDTSTGTYVFTPDTGAPFIESDNGAGVTVAPAGGFVGINTLTITRQDGADFYFALDDVSMDSSLPVELTRFVATADGADALLQWDTASETNNAGFEVQVDAGAGFTAAGWLPGHGTTPESHRYAYRAEDLTPGTYRFRLKQVDFDGAFVFSPAVELTIAPRGYTLTAPSNFGDHAEVQLAAERSQHVQVALYDLLGREVQVLHDAVVEGTAQLSLTGASLPSGVYFLRATGETFTVTHQVVRVR